MQDPGAWQQPLRGGCNIDEENPGERKSAGGEFSNSFAKGLVHDDERKSPRCVVGPNKI